MLSQVDANGQSFTRDYDALNRLTDTHYPNTVTPYLTLRQIHTDYDANSNVTQVTETKHDTQANLVSDTTKNVYDAFDRLSETTQRGVKINYAYDANGNRIQVSTANGRTAYTYDARNRLETATADVTETTRYVYTPDGRKHTISYPNGTLVSYDYDPTNRIKSIAHSNENGLISSYNYQYDVNGNRTQQTELQNGSSELTTYHYDALNRMLNYTVVSGTTRTITDYTFEGHNRKSEKVTQQSGNDPATTTKQRTYYYDEINRLKILSDETNPLAQYLLNYTYDNNGNTLTKQDTSKPADDLTYQYNSRNELIQILKGPQAQPESLGQYD